MNDIDNMTKPQNAYKKQYEYLQIIYKNKGIMKNIFGVEKLALIFLVSFQFILPSILLRYISGFRGTKARKRCVESYTILKPIILTIILFFDPNSLFSKIIAIVFLVDVVSYLLNLVFISRLYTSPISIERTLFLLFINVFEITIGYAVLYLGFNAICINTISPTVVRDPFSSFYFSLVTFTTLGYGDIIPYALPGKVLVTLELLTSFVFLSTIFSFFVSKLSKRESNLPSEKWKVN